MNYYKYLKIGFSTLFLIILLLGFSGDFSISSLFTNKDLVAQIGNQKIMKNDFDEAINYELRSMRVEGEIKLEDKIELQKEVLKNLINEKLLVKFADDLNLLISDDAMIDEIKKSPIFTNQETGLFDKKRFGDMLVQIGKTEHEYLQEMKKSLALYSVFYAFNTRAAIPINIRDTIILNSLNKIRIVDEILINTEKIQFDEKANNDEVEKYYKEHGDDFKTSEYRKLDYLTINNKDFIDKVKIDQKELEKRGEELFKAMENKEIRNFYNIICDDEQYAQNLKTELENEKNHSELLKSEDNLKNKVGNSCRTSFLKEKKITDLPEEFRDFVFSLKENAISEVKKTSFGYNLILMKDAKNIDIKNFLPEIEEKMKTEQSYELTRKEIENIKNDLIKNQHLKIQNIAEKYNLKIQEFDYFDDDGYYKKNLVKSINDDYPISRDIFNIIYKSDIGKIGIEANQEDYFIYSVSDVIQSKKKDFEKVRDDILDIIQSNYKEKKSSELVNQVFDDLEKNNFSTEDLEKKYGNALSISKNKKIQHPEVVKSMESNQNTVFSSEVIFSVKDKQYIKVNDQIIILKNFDKSSMNEVEKSQYLNIIERNMTHIENKEIMESIFQYLRTKYKVTIHEKNIALN